MEKQSYLPIKFYHRNGVQDYEKIKNYSDDIAIPKFPAMAFPGFQLVMPNEVQGRILTDWVYGNFRIFLINYDTGTEWNYFTFEIDGATLYDAGDFWVLVVNTFPWETIPTNIMDDLGRFYYRVEYDNPAEAEWYSEVFEMCNMELDATTSEFVNESGWTSFSSVRHGNAGDEYVEVEFCYGGGADGLAELPLECFPGEEFDIYIKTDGHDGTPVCGETDWVQDVFLSIRGAASGRYYSDEIVLSTIDQFVYRRLVCAGGAETETDELYLELLADSNTKGKFEIWVQRTWKAGHVQLAYTNTRNFCKIVYEDDYMTRMFLDAKQVIDNKQLEEKVVEDDEANKYRIIGTNQNYHSIKFVGGEYLLNAMSLLRLHDDITIVNEDGEPMDVVELLIEQSVIDYEAAEIKLLYREESCSWEYCGFTTA